MNKVENRKVKEFWIIDDGQKKKVLASVKKHAESLRKEK